MNKSTLIGLVAGIGIAATVAGIAGYAVIEESDEPAVAVSTEECIRSGTEQPRDEKRIAGTVVGALIGGAVGNDVGDSDLTTAAGAAAGAYAGRKAQEEYQEGRSERAAATDC